MNIYETKRNSTFRCIWPDRQKSYKKVNTKCYKIIAVTRNIHRAGYILKTQANPGYLELVEIKNFNIDKIEELMNRCSICINLIIYF